MRRFFNLKAGIATVAAAFTALALYGFSDDRWTPDDIRAHLHTSTDVPVIKDPAARAEFAINVMFVGMKDNELADEAMALLLKMKDDPAAEVRSSVAQGIVRVGYFYEDMSTDEKIAVLQEMVASNPDDAGLRRDVAYWMGSMAEQSPAEAAKIMPLLQQMLKDTEGVVRTSAVGAIGTVGYRVAPQAPAALGAILPMANDENPLVRQRVAGLLNLVSGEPDQDRVLPVLIALSADTESAKVREQAVLSLSARTFRGEEQAEQIYDALMTRVNDPQEAEDVRVFLPGRLSDIARIHPRYFEKALAVAGKMIKDDPSERVRYMAVVALRDIAFRSPEKVIPQLVAVAIKQEESLRTRHEAIMGIGIMPQGMPEQAQAVITALQEIQKSPMHPDLQESVQGWIDFARAQSQQATPQPAPEIPRP